MDVMHACLISSLDRITGYASSQPTYIRGTSPASLTTILWWIKIFLNPQKVAKLNHLVDEVGANVSRIALKGPLDVDCPLTKRPLSLSQPWYMSVSHVGWTGFLSYRAACPLSISGSERSESISLLRLVVVTVISTATCFMSP